MREWAWARSRGSDLHLPASALGIGRSKAVRGLQTCVAFGRGLPRREGDLTAKVTPPLGLGICVHAG